MKFLWSCTQLHVGWITHRRISCNWGLTACITKGETFEWGNYTLQPTGSVFILFCPLDLRFSTWIHRSLWIYFWYRYASLRVHICIRFFRVRTGKILLHLIGEWQEVVLLWLSCLLLRICSVFHDLLSLCVGLKQHAVIKDATKVAMIYIWLPEQNYWGNVFCVYLQELLYLYGFVVDNNPDDYLMVTLTLMYVLKVCNKICRIYIWQISFSG